MSLKVCVLSSGSSGNCTYVGSESVGVLIDAGLSCKETMSRLGSIGVDLNGISAICLSHEHDDHKSSLGALYRRTGVALYANSGTIESVERDVKFKGLPWNVFTTGSPFEVGDIRIEPFSVPHDSYDPVGFVFCSGGSRIGVVTDMGMATELVRERLKGCRAVVIEANHDSEMLKNSERPWSLKQRIAGRQGHFSNENAGALLTEIAGPELSVVFLAHLSSDCNTPEVAEKKVREALNACGRSDVIIKLTYQSRLSDVVVV